VRLFLKIDESYLICHTLKNSSSDRFSSKDQKSDIVALQNAAWKASELNYKFLAGSLFDNPIDVSKQFLESITRSIPEYLASLQASPEYAVIYKQTKEYLNGCEEQWSNNFEKTEKLVKSLTGIEFNDDFTVFITHPSLKNGRFIGNKTIVWGHHEDWPNYTTVYLWHEILHYYLGNTKVSHALIQFITDNELRVDLNSGTYPPFEGHHELFKVMEQSLSLWQNYLGSETKNLNELKKEIEALVDTGTKETAFKS